MKLKYTTIALSLTVGLTSGAWASGEGEHGLTSDGHMEHAGDMNGMGHGMEVDRTIEVTARDIEFDLSEIEVVPGETIRFVIHNEGMADHDFTIGNQAMQDAHREEMMEMMMAGDMAAHHADANAVMIPAGETGELIWTFADTEDVMFGCNVPGHFESGMHGDFVVGSEE